ncbi:hypothetical protein BVER_03520 [Candidatus Burkholderia verschuerenii]|uniref:RES domain-containing protein n=1 Tax=Candidatus Burkholderia verschuerenii TaxID=242163 RepID=A0A0L0M8C7_9BURK|nr:hypothetical protein BVER_03520 [Candidatus Burkholderia verschuerenii]
MQAGNEAVLHKIVFSKASLGTYWHVYPNRFAPTSSNRNSKARLAWRDGSHGMFYTGATRAAALWETVLRHASVDDGYVYTDRLHLKDMMLARLELTVETPILDLRPPYRRAIVDAPSELDEQWDRMLKDPDHDNTHAFTAKLMQQLRAAGHGDGAALMWYSRQAGNETATLFYDPPMQSNWWRFKNEELYCLDTPEGEAQIRLALAEQGLLWRAAPESPEFFPPVDAQEHEFGDADSPEERLGDSPCVPEVPVA